MTPTQKAIHKETSQVSREYRKNECVLIECLKKCDEFKVYLALEKSSLFAYAVEVLLLSDNMAFTLIQIARKSKEIPALQEAVEKAEISVSKARRLCAVVDKDNQEQWLEIAKATTHRELERKVAAVNPQQKVPARIRPQSEERSVLTLSIPVALEKQIRRIQDLESKRVRKNADLEKALSAMAEAYLDKNDPLRKAARAEKRNSASDTALKAKTPVGSVPSRRAQIPKQLIHAVNLRDENQCTEINSLNERCPNRRYLEIHHRRPVAMGGDNSLENLTILCNTHHRHWHDVLRARN